MLLAGPGKYLTCIFVLLTSCLILNSIAIPVPSESTIQTPESDDNAKWHTVYPIDRGVERLSKFVDKDCTPIEAGKPTPDKCKLRIRKDGLLSLRKKNEKLEDEGMAIYTLHERIGSGTFGIVLRATRGKPEEQHAATSGDSKDQPQILAKWLRYPDHYGVIEVSNTKDVGEAVDYGIDGEKNAGLWLIINLKDGVELRKLPSYKEATSSSGTKENCMKYMGEVREAIVDASREYVKKESAPIHNSLLIRNVLFTEEEGVKRAKLIDFGRLYLNLQDQKMPTEDDEKRALDKVKYNLENGEYYGREYAEKNMKGSHEGGEKNRREEKEDSGDEDAGYVEVPDVNDYPPPWESTFTDNLHCGHLNP